MKRPLKDGQSAAELNELFTLIFGIGECSQPNIFVVGRSERFSKIQRHTLGVLNPSNK